MVTTALILRSACGDVGQSCAVLWEGRATRSRQLISEAGRDCDPSQLQFHALQWESVLAMSEHF